MKLTDEEKQVFMLHDEDLIQSPSWHIEDGLIRSYDENDHIVQVTNSYIKRVLIEVAKQRGLNISDDISFDIDKLLKDIIKVPEIINDIDVLFFKNYDDLNKYINDKIIGKNSDYMKGIFNKFNGIGGIIASFGDFMSEYVRGFSNNINELEFEASLNDEKDADSEPIIVPIESEESEWSNDFEDSTQDFKENENDADIESIIVPMESEELDWFSDFEDSYQVSNKEEKKKVTDEELIDYIRYINTYQDLMECKNNATKVTNELGEIMRQTILNEFYSNKEFYEDFQKIMQHDRSMHTYYFHGTQDLESAGSIVKEGLGMMHEELSSTTYEEFSMDDVILYSRGLGGEIGRYAVVIIDRPIDGDGKRENIVEKKSDNRKIQFVPSGLQGLNGKLEYIIDSKYIVGYVDKKNKKIIFNTKYYDYSRFESKVEENRPKEVPFSNERVAEGVQSFEEKNRLELEAGTIKVDEGEIKE